MAISKAQPWEKFKRHPISQLTFLLERDNIGIDTVRVLHSAIIVPKVLFGDGSNNQFALESVATRPLIQPVVFTFEGQREPVAAPEYGGGWGNGKSIAHQFGIRTNPPVDNGLVILDPGRAFHQDLGRGRNFPETLYRGTTNVLADGGLVDAYRQISIVVVHLHTKLRKKNYCKFLIFFDFDIFNQLLFSYN